MPRVAQWVFYLFGAAAVLWLPFWLPLRMDGGSRSGIGGSSGKSFNVLTLFSSGDAADGSTRGGSGVQALPGSGAEGSRLQRVRSTLSDDYAGVGGMHVEGCLIGHEGLEPGALATLLLGNGPGWRPLGLKAACADPTTHPIPAALGAASEAETEWSDGVAVAYKMEQQRQLGVGFTALLKTKPVWAICVAQYTGSWGFYGERLRAVLVVRCSAFCVAVCRCISAFLGCAILRGASHRGVVGRPCAAPPPAEPASPTARFLCAQACSTGCPRSSKMPTMWRLRSWPPSPCCRTWCRAAWARAQVRANKCVPCAQLVA